MATIPLAVIKANIRGEEIKGKGSFSSHGVFNPVEGEYRRLKNQMEKCKRRIEKHKLFLSGAITEENAELKASARAKVQKEEELYYRCVMKLKQRMAEKDRIDEREVKKFHNRQDVEFLRKVRLEKSKLVEREVSTLPKEEAKDYPDTLTTFRKAKGSTSKNVRYDEMKPGQVRREFLAVLDKNIQDSQKKKRVSGKSLTVTRNYPYKGNVIVKSNVDNLVTGFDKKFSPEIQEEIDKVFKK